jgi:hypothetical protein
LVVSDLEWLRQQLSRYSYRPTWTFEVEYMPDPLAWVDRYSILTRFKVMNSYPPHQEIEIKSLEPVPSFVIEHHDAEAFKRWFPVMIWYVEQHESKEWLRRDGELVDDPHKQEKILPQIS